jgi:xylan 1,4-beta-xylosidase
MWSGTDADYLRLYRIAAKAIKAEFPAVKVGGPALGASGSFENGEFRPTKFATDFLTMCRREKVPLNFFSWHCYTADPTELVARARAVRRLLDSHGLNDTENHLNEWNYLPGNSWKPLSKSASAAERQRAYAEMAGAPGAAFLATALIQDTPLDVANLFHGELGGFGLFTEHGAPQKAWQALRAFRGLLDTARRVPTRGATPGKVAIAAGLSADGRSASLLVSNFADSREEFIVEWKGIAWSNGVTAEIRTVDETHDFQNARHENFGASNSLRLKLKAPALALIRLTPISSSSR